MQRPPGVEKRMTIASSVIGPLLSVPIPSAEYRFIPVRSGGKRPHRLFDQGFKFGLQFRIRIVQLNAENIGLHVLRQVQPLRQIDGVNSAFLICLRPPNRI